MRLQRPDDARVVCGAQRARAKIEAAARDMNLSVLLPVVVTDVDDGGMGGGP